MKCNVCSSLLCYQGVYAKAFCVGDNGQWGVNNIVCYLDGGSFVGDSQYLTFVRVEFHFVFSLPGLKGVEVALECSGVLCVPNGPVQKAIVCK